MNNFCRRPLWLLAVLCVLVPGQVLAQKKQRADAGDVALHALLERNQQQRAQEAGCAQPTAPPTRSMMGPGALEQLQARLEQAEAARTDDTNPDTVLYGHNNLYKHASMAGIAKAALVLSTAYYRKADKYDTSLRYDLRNDGRKELARAAALGLDEAQHALALECAKPYPAQARQWMQKAAAQGHEGARQWLQANP